MKSSIITKNNMSKSLENINKRLDTLPKLAFKEFVKNTPVRKGNARKNTKLQGNTIVANYPYARRLDEGYSKQSPDGMTKPTEEYVKNTVDKMMRK